MKIELLAPPFSGHLHPTLGLARALAPEYEVRVLSTQSMQRAIAACGLRGETILTAEDEQWMWAIANQPYAVKSHLLRMYRQLQQALQLMARLRAALLQRWTVQRPDLVIVDFTLPPAGLLALELGIPWWTSLPSPCVLEAPDGPPAYLGGLQPARHAPARALHAAARLMVRGVKRGLHAWHRREMAALGLSAIYRSDGSEAMYSPQCILALGVEALEFERQWPAALHFVGPMLCTPPLGHPEPPFQPGRRHLLVTAGTHQDWAKQRLADAACDLAKRHSDWIVHFSDGHAHRQSVQASKGPPNFLRLPFVDYERHLARYAMLLHHGGAGVLYHALSAGIPSIVYPLDYDQFDNATRLHAGCAGLRLKRLKDLPAMFLHALQDPNAFSGLSALQQAVREQMAEERTQAMVRELSTGLSVTEQTSSSFKCNRSVPWR